HDVHPHPLVQRRRPSLVLRIDSQTGKSAAPSTELKERVTEQCLTDPSPSPGSTGPEHLHPSHVVHDLAFEDGDYLAALFGYPPQTGIEAVLMQPMGGPLVEAAGDEPPVIGEGVLDNPVEGTVVPSQDEGPDADARSAGGWGQVLQRRLHP